MQRFLTLMITISIMTCTLLTRAPEAFAQQNSYSEATVVSIEESDADIEALPDTKLYTVKLEDSEGKTITLENELLPDSLSTSLKTGDTVLLGTSSQGDEEVTYIADVRRTPQMLLLVGLFFVIIVAVGRWQGASSFIGMLISFFVIVKIVVPQILAGTNPIVAALLGGLIIIPATFYLSHGINTKTTIGIVGTMFSLLLTGLLAVVFVSFTRLTGLSAEESSILQLYTDGVVNMRELLLGGIIIGAMGILDDITISQASIVERLKKANASYTRWDLYKESMIVGRDHIASLVNTLILVYAGASLPLFVLFVNQELALAPIVNHEIIATEVVRTIVSSIGIILAVPITSAIASWELYKG